MTTACARGNHLHRPRATVFLCGLIVLMDLYAGGSVATAVADERTGHYRSPYSVEFTLPREELIGDLERGERGEVRLESEVPHAHWYTRGTRDRWKSWGPPARHYPPLAGLENRSTAWKRERVIAVALRFVGYGYQHHHIPDWDPPADWPWKETAVGHNGKGVDCSNFTGFVYNQGFGIRMNGEIQHQAELRHAEMSAGATSRVNHEVPLHRVELPADYAARIKSLRTGDLLFIRNIKGDHVSHVVLWVGPIGRSPENLPLIIDSHGDGVKDSEGASIPAGIHLRPYREGSWYHRSASHALRVFRGD